MNTSFYFSNIDCEAIRAWIDLKLGRSLSFIIINAFLIMKLSKLPSFNVIQTPIASQSMFE